MAKFKDNIVIKVRAGKGGAGAVSFRREKYIPKGGPDGGDGGKGGDVIIQATQGYYNLGHLFKDRIYKAQNGGFGMGQNRHGKDGQDLIINVPAGTQVLDAESGELLADLVREGNTVCVARGGMGGKGNAFFKTATHQAPRFAQPGMPGEERSILLNLKLIADVGLVGLPNVGKSTLLKAITNAQPKIADYPFTTLIPNLGVIERGETVIKIADIPGIIEGAHKGLGLGLSFLQHIERVRIILFCIEAIDADPLYTLSLLKAELSTYNKDLPQRTSMILLTKSDSVNESVILKRVALLEKEKYTVLPISSLTGYNMDILIEKLFLLME
ncbi:MAG TPA: GTPase ObgE [Spirochaetota bacterium]|nr:GTPase ObgE [Spirochaetota bacterium]HOM09327.1 GTPase ObgE [Spirochaetota bacterium]HPP50002.1 GTPase ObgE [Spirochaetota bacterium]HXK66135.1 GTPase ObgE [Spirochaetota bacterium]